MSENAQNKTEMLYLRGVECIVSAGYGGEKDQSGYVVHADREKGITIHSLQTDLPIFCLNKETLSQMRCKDKNRIYHTCFTEIVKAIEKGEKIGLYVFHAQKGRILQAEYSPFRFFQTCAYR